MNHNMPLNEHFDTTEDVCKKMPARKQVLGEFAETCLPRITIGDSNNKPRNCRSGIMTIIGNVIKLYHGKEGEFAETCLPRITIGDSNNKPRNCRSGIMTIIGNVIKLYHGKEGFSQDVYAPVTLKNN